MPSHEKNSISGALAQSIGRPKVLLLEDNDASALLLQDTLETVSTAELVWVKSLAELEILLDEVSRNRFAMIILDVNLPDGECWNLAGQIRAVTDAYICAYTARNSLADVQRLKSVGFDQILPKPINLSEFMGVVGRVLDPPARG